MIVATDVGYEGTTATAAVVGFDAWSDDRARVEQTAVSTTAAPYKPGAFFEHELPSVLPLVRKLCVDHDARTVVVDGYVQLGSKLGLGGHLRDALAADGLEIVVIGVAKNPFRGAPAMEIHRGSSGRALYVSALGVETKDAAGWIEHMHGPHRIPTLLRRVDQLARGVAS